MKIKAGIIGATGYAGLEIVRLLLNHPEVEIAAVSSVSYTGKRLSEVHPCLSGLLDMVLEDDKAVLEKCQVIFASLPHGLSEEIARACRKADKILIDMGADFRLESGKDYKEWYGGDFQDSALHASAVYAIPELFREKIKTTKLIANPGCYPTSVALGLAPAIKEKLLDLSTVIIDAKSGVSGAGRGLSQNTHFPDCNENFAPYKVAQHRHTPEIEQTLSILAGERVTVTFVPHLLPVNRGILSTIYAGLVEKVPARELYEIYSEFYKNEPFVRVLAPGKTAGIRGVQFSNYCDISLHCDERTGRVVIASAIDNMIKGAAGQAVQNMNLVCGFGEETGLRLVPPAV